MDHPFNGWISVRRGYY